MTTKAYNATNKAKLKQWYRLRHVRKTYGLTKEKYESKLLTQNHCCEICSRILDEPHVDHDHISGQVRDILCGPCNRALGLFQENVLVMKNAVAYLERWKA